MLLATFLSQGVAAQGVAEVSLSQVRLVGTATEGGQAVQMSELAPEGKPSGVYEAYMKAQPGEFVIQGNADGKSLTLGHGNRVTEVRPGGKPFRISQEQVVRVRLDTRKDSLSIQPVTLCLRGNIVQQGTQVEYAGHGVWQSKVEMTHGDVFLFSDKYFYFAFNDDDALAVKRLRGNRTSVEMPSEGFQGENIRINRGTYTLTLDMNKHTWDIDAPVNEYRISAFGSSVCNGEGAEGHKGYAYMYGQQLAERYSRGQSKMPFEVSGVSIGGNTTINLLDRYDEMLHDFGRYVIIGLSLGNEGIHGARDPQAIFDQFHRNMLTLISKCREDGKIPVVMNNYTRGDYTPEDYAYVKRMNLDIHRWQVPSVNVLGAIDNGEGKWADGYMRDNWHQDTKGHQEFMYAIPPSLFDALREGKPYPTRRAGKGITLRKGSTIEFAGEGILHPFTVTLRAVGGKAGRILAISTDQGEATLSIVKGGMLQYALGGKTLLQSEKNIVPTKNVPYDITLTHYYAQGRTLLYLDGQLIGEVKERIAPTLFVMGDCKSGTSRTFTEVSLWRSAMTQEEIEMHHQGECMKSSLEIYTPLDEEMKTTGFPNLAQSLNGSVRFLGY